MGFFKTKFKTIMVNVRNIRIDFLNVNIKVIIDNDVIKARNQLCKYYPKLPQMEYDTSTEGLHTAYYNYYPGKHWIFLRKNALISTISHEILHCVDTISSHYNIKDTEFRAYLLDYILTRIIGLKRL